MFRGSVKSTGYTLHSPVSPSLPLRCVTVCHHISTGLYCRCFVCSRPAVDSRSRYRYQRHSSVCAVNTKIVRPFRLGLLPHIYIYMYIKWGVQNFLFQKSGITCTDVGAKHVKRNEGHTGTHRHCAASRPLAGPLPLKPSFDLRSGHVGFVEDWIPLRQVCLRVLRSRHYHSATSSYSSSF